LERKLAIPIHGLRPDTAGAFGDFAAGQHFGNCSRFQIEIPNFIQHFIASMVEPFKF
jgi:hypothetical protein